MFNGHINHFINIINQHQRCCTCMTISSHCCWVVQLINTIFHLDNKKLSSISSSSSSSRCSTSTTTNSSSGSTCRGTSSSQSHGNSSSNSRTSMMRWHIGIWYDRPPNGGILLPLVLHEHRTSKPNLLIHTIQHKRAVLHFWRDLRKALEWWALHLSSASQISRWKPHSSPPSRTTNTNWPNGKLNSIFQFSRLNCHHNVEL